MKLLAVVLVLALFALGCESASSSGSGDPATDVEELFARVEHLECYLAADSDLEDADTALADADAVLTDSYDAYLADNKTYAQYRRDFAEYEDQVAEYKKAGARYQAEVSRCRSVYEDSSPY